MGAATPIRCQRPAKPGCSAPTLRLLELKAGAVVRAHSGVRLFIDRGFARESKLFEKIARPPQAIPRSDPRTG
jgi:hypothetical protein